MRRILLLSLAVLAVVSYTEAKSQGTHNYDGTISFDLAGNSSVQRQHALDILWKAVQNAFGRANGISSKGEGDHNGSGRISGTVNFAGERQRGDKEKKSTTSSTNEVENEVNVDEVEGEDVEEIITFEDDD